MDQVLSDGRTYRVQVADALSQEIRIKNVASQGPVIGPILFLLFVNDLSTVINVTTLFFAYDTKMASLRSQSDLLQSSIYNVRNLSVHWYLPSNLPTATTS